jgi:predicted ester cyclase
MHQKSKSLRKQAATLLQLLSLSGTRAHGNLFVRVRHRFSGNSRCRLRFVHTRFLEREPHREDYLQVLASLFTAFQGQFTIEDLIAEREKVVLRFTYRGIHQGQWRGPPPTGKSVMFTGTITYRIVDGKAVEAWANEDILSLMHQLGLLPKQG